MSCFQFSRDPWTRVDNVRRYILYVVPTYRTYMPEGTGTRCTCIISVSCLYVCVYLYGANNDQRSEEVNNESVETASKSKNCEHLIAQELKLSTAGAFDAHTTAPAAPHFRPSH